MHLLLPFIAPLLIAAPADPARTAGAPRATSTPSSHIAVADSMHRAVFERGISYAEFLAKAERRKEQWQKNSTWTTPPDALVTRARATGNGWKLLAVAVDGCSDSVNTIPYIAQLVAMLPGVELRIVDSDVGRAIMDAHKTPDGRGATPTVLLLDANYVERGAFIERPTALLTFLATQSGTITGDATSPKMRWYDDDKGVSTLTDLVTLMERARAARGDR